MVFAVDSTTFQVARFDRWYDKKRKQAVEEKATAKANLICGIRTHVIAEVTATDSDERDSPEYPRLLHGASKRFRIGEVSADAAYSSLENYRATDEVGAVPIHEPAEMRAKSLRRGLGKTHAALPLAHEKSATCSAERIAERDDESAPTPYTRPEIAGCAERKMKNGVVVTDRKQVVNHLREEKNFFRPSPTGKPLLRQGDRSRRIDLTGSDKTRRRAHWLRKMLLPASVKQWRTQSLDLLG